MHKYIKHSFFRSPVVPSANSFNYLFSRPPQFLGEFSADLLNHDHDHNSNLNKIGKSGKAVRMCSILFNGWPEVENLLQCGWHDYLMFTFPCSFSSSKKSEMYWPVKDIHLLME